MKKVDNIRKLSLAYIRQTVFISAALTVAGLIVMQVWFLDRLLAPVVISAVFSLVIGTADALIWRKVARSSPENIPTFHTAVSGFRMLLALLVMFIYYVADSSDTMLEFFLVFMTYYVAQMVHHAWFFTRKANLN